MKTHRRLVTLVLGAAIGGLAFHALGQPGADRPAARSPGGTYDIDAKKGQGPSRFIAETETSGLTSMFGHDHRIEITDFHGKATFSPAAPGRASLELTIRADSFHLLGEDNIGARQSIETALREDVLETAKYPEIVFKSRKVTSSRRGDGTYDVRLSGDLTLHGVLRPVTIPARVSLEPGALHAIGTFDVRQTDFNITPFSFVSGTVTIKDTVTLSFDIIAPQRPQS